MDWVALLGMQARTDVVKVALCAARDVLGPDDLLRVSFSGYGQRIGPECCGYLLGTAPYDLFQDGMVGPRG